MSIRITDDEMREIAELLDSSIPGTSTETAQLSLDDARTKSLSATEWFVVINAAVTGGKLLWFLLPRVEIIINALQKDGIDGRTAAQHIYAEVMKDYKDRMQITKAKYEHIAKTITKYLVKKYFTKE